MKNKYHKHADLIIAWDKGTKIQQKIHKGDEEYWEDVENPTWDIKDKYRVKPFFDYPEPRIGETYYSITTLFKIEKICMGKR